MFDSLKCWVGCSVCFSVLCSLFSQPLPRFSFGLCDVGTSCFCTNGCRRLQLFGMGWRCCHQLLGSSRLLKRTNVLQKLKLTLDKLKTYNERVAKLKKSKRLGCHGQVWTAIFLWSIQKLWRRFWGVLNDEAVNANARQAGLLRAAVWRSSILFCLNLKAIGEFIK